MTRVYVICEGQTEAQFVEKALAPALLPQETYLFASLIGIRGHKGGNFSFERLCRDLNNFLKNDATAYCTTLFDFYGLPETFPGKAEASGCKGSETKAERLTATMRERLLPVIGDRTLRRFIPYVQMHEFEGILFSDPALLAHSINQPGLEAAFSEIRKSFASPEDINNSPNSAPSKRITGSYPSYQKPIDGLKAVQLIGLETIRAECRLFDTWLRKLEALPASP